VFCNPFFRVVLCFSHVFDLKPEQQHYECVERWHGGPPPATGVNVSLLSEYCHTECDTVGALQAAVEGSEVLKKQARY